MKRDNNIGTPQLEYELLLKDSLAVMAFIVTFPYDFVIIPLIWKITFFGSVIGMSILIYRTIERMFFKAYERIEKACNSYRAVKFIRCHSLNINLLGNFPIILIDSFVV